MSEESFWEKSPRAVMILTREGESDAPDKRRR